MICAGVAMAMGAAPGVLKIGSGGDLRVWDHESDPRLPLLWFQVHRDRWAQITEGCLRLLQVSRIKLQELPDMSLEGWIKETEEAGAALIRALDELDRWITELLPRMDELRAIVQDRKYR